MKWHTRLTREEVLLPVFAFVLFVVFYVSATKEHAVSGQEVSGSELAKFGTTSI